MEYLTQKVEDLNERDQTGKTTIKQTSQQEENRNDYKIIRKVLKPKWSKETKYLDVPLDISMENWKRITDRNEVENIFIERNIKPFKQADQTPFANENLIKIFGYKGVSSTAQNLINNKIRPNDTFEESEFVNHFIDKLSESKIRNINGDISFEEFKKAIKSGMRTLQHHQVDIT
jgi:hypothetical protein